VKRSDRREWLAQLRLRGTPALRTTLAVVAGVFLSAACSLLETRAPVATGSAYHHSTHEASQAPEPATNCVVRNAVGAGYATLVQPLYGTAALAVRVRTLIAGGTPIVSLSILPAGRGSEISATTLRNGVEDREALLSKLLAGC
jgi:hypothetical protein